MSDNSIKLVTINELLECNFFIPSYQRGYRWNKQQVLDLLNDIWEFTEKEKTKDEFYCLQPVVVKEKEDSKKEKWEVIDGQQRLTTIYIILTYINKYIFKQGDSIFSMEYETRPSSQEFLINIDENKRDENIDYFHICSAFNNIDEWFKSKGNLALTAMKFYPILLNSTKFIWYQINDGSDAIDIFTRINMGKIPLTNAELIKALFLKSNNFGKDLDTIRLKQLEIANEWDRIEYTLQNESFWYFINNGEHEYETRIEFIFDLMSSEINNGCNVDKRIQKENNDFFSFLVFNQCFKEKEQEEESHICVIDELWMNIKQYFMTFEEWFNNRKFYHLVGYLICAGEKIEKIKAETKMKTKTEFEEYLISRIKVYVNLQISELTYGNKNIKNVLLLFNIETLLANKDSNVNFPFDRYKNEKWDIEHIHAVMSKMPSDKSMQREWLKEVNKQIHVADTIEMEKKIKSNNLKERIEAFIGQDTSNNDDSFDKLYSEVLSIYGEDDDINDISNLALLDSITNSSYKNAVFPTKRKTILERDKKGIFIPLCTKNVFLKYYSKNINQMSFWSKEDREEYAEAIKFMLKKYLPVQVEGAEIDG